MKDLFLRALEPAPYQSGTALRLILFDDTADIDDRLLAAARLIRRLEDRQQWLERRARTHSASVAELTLDLGLITQANRQAHFAEIVRTAYDDASRIGIEWLGKNFGVYERRHEPRPASIPDAITEAIFSLAGEYEDFEATREAAE